MGQPDEATAELKEYFQNRKTGKPDDWPAEISKFLAGQASESELFKRAQDEKAPPGDPQRCEAFYYAGVKRLMSGDKGAAREDFQKCLATNLKDFTEYQSAADRIDLAQIGIPAFQFAATRYCPAPFFRSVGSLGNFCKPSCQVFCA